MANVGSYLSRLWMHHQAWVETTAGEIVHSTEHEERLKDQVVSFAYLLYTTVIWFFYFVDFNLVKTAVQNPGTVIDALSHACKNDSARVGGFNSFQCPEYYNYGVFYHLRHLVPDHNVYVILVNSIFVFFLIHTLRIFLGVYFAANDQSFRESLQENMYAKMNDEQQSKFKCSALIMTFCQIVLLGLFTFYIKSGSKYLPVVIVFCQTILFVVFDVVFHQAIWNDRDKWTKWVVWLSDGTSFITAGLLLMLVFNINVPLISDLINRTATARVVFFVLEFFGAYLASVGASLWSIVFLISALLRVKSR